MSVPVTVKYLGDLHCEAVHGPSHAKLDTDAPVDNQGKGAAFSPTDLVATAAATCMATTMAIVARRHGLDLTGVEVSIEKVMSQDSPRRIVSLASEIWMPIPSTHPHRELLENTARACPVHQSIHPDIQRPITFHWKGE
ncbi:osmotically inducible protein OsmC [Verrucomicrobia bacterium SCGC AG-212-E04]|nr:osmotically inducible protein OsmC [Verrucomicrobia bacterium SCGC AG-212-E04]